MIIVFTWKDNIYFNASHLAYQVSHFKRAPKWMRSRRGREAIAKVLDQKISNYPPTPSLLVSDETNKPLENEDQLYKKDKILWLHELLMPYFCRWLADWVEELFQSAMSQKSGESGQIKINAKGHERDNTSSHKKIKTNAGVGIALNEEELCDECPTDEEVGRMHPGQKKPRLEESPIHLNYQNKATEESLAPTKNGSSGTQSSHHHQTYNFSQVEWRHTNRTVPPGHGILPVGTQPQPIFEGNHSFREVARVQLPPLSYTRTQSALHNQTMDSHEHRSESQIVETQRPVETHWNLSSTTEWIRIKERELEIAKELLSVEQERIQVLERKILFELWSKTEKDDADIQLIKQSVHLFLSTTFQTS